MMGSPTRREFLWAAVAAAWAFGESTAPAQPGSVRVRRSVFSPNAPIADYRDGVRVMKTRAITDPTSWLYQANMHSTYTTPPMGALWNQCQHGSFFFFSWHRMYLYWFERIVRKACGNNAFALPYWNYTSTAGSARQLPLEFRQVQFNGQPNALYDSTRAPGMNNISNPSQIPYSSTLYSTAFAYTNFTSPTGSALSFGGQIVNAPTHFSNVHGQLEAQPHDVIHGVVGGSGNFGDPNRSGRDPIFWLHHANIDRLWNRWLQQGGGRSNPTGNAVWMNTVFKFFDENGTQVEMKGSDVLDTVAQLQYRYDDDPVVLAPAAAIATDASPRKEKPLQTLATAEKTGVKLGTRPVSVSIGLKEPAKEAVKSLIDAKPADAADHAIVLRLEDVTFDKPPGIYYEVYLNLPAEEDDPEFSNGRYVGNLGFFAMLPVEGHDDHAMAGDVAKAAYMFDISGLIRALSKEKDWDPDKATVTFVPRGLEDSNGQPMEVKTDAKITMGKITLEGPKK